MSISTTITAVLDGVHDDADYNVTVVGVADQVEVSDGGRQAKFVLISGDSAIWVHAYPIQYSIAQHLLPEPGARPTGIRVAVTGSVHRRGRAAELIAHEIKEAL